jgi:hypothetical protein
MSRSNLWEAPRFSTKFLAATIVVFVVAAATVGFVTRSKPDRKVIGIGLKAPVPQAAPPSPLVVTDGQATRDRTDTQWLTGMVVNNTQKAYRYVEISYNLYDSTGGQIGIASAHTSGLEPNGRWMFKTVIDDKCADFKLAKLEGM